MKRDVIRSSEAGKQPETAVSYWRGSGGESAFIRELHVSGRRSASASGGGLFLRGNTEKQKGLQGTLKESERIAREEYGKEWIAVLSGVEPENITAPSSGTVRQGTTW
jgi:histone acetyltransferase (RNA polymerase elongator complex component)